MISTQFLNDCISGDENAIQTLVRTHQRAVFQLALTVIDDTETPTGEVLEQAEIATRETFIAALDRLARYPETMPFITWLYRIGIQVSRRRYRRWKTAQRLRGLLPKKRRQAAPAEGQPAQETLQDPLWQAVRRLDERLRLPVVLRYYHDFPIDEIARLLRLSEGAIHARLDAAREKIADPNPV